MDSGDCSAPSNPTDCDQSQRQETISKMPQSTLKNATTKPDDQDEHLRNNIGVKSCLENSSGNTNCLTSDNLLAAASNSPKKEITSLGFKSESTCSENEQCPLDLVEDKEASVNVKTVSKGIASNNGEAVDEFSKDPEKLGTECNSNDREERKLNDVISEGRENELHSDAAMANPIHTCNSNRKEEIPVKRRESDVHAPSDINFPVRMSASELRMNSSEQRMQPPTLDRQKNKKSEVKQKSDSLRPVGRLLHDLGLDLVREQVYKDLIGIQIGKDAKNMLDEKEKEQLKRLTDAHSKLIVKNAGYQLPFVSCRCNFSSSSANVLALHHEFGSTLKIPFHVCCLCENLKTRWPSQFLAHLECLHQKKGRLQTKLAPYVCKWCPYEHKNLTRMEAHTGRCFKKFNLNTNLQPLPADCDVPLMGKTSLSIMPSQSSRPGMMAAPSGLPHFSAGHGVHNVGKHTMNPATASNVQPSVMEIGGQLYSLVHHNGKALFTSLRSQIANVSVGNHNSSTTSSTVVPGSFPRFAQPLAKPIASDRTSSASKRVPFLEKCEMCDTVVKDRDALWNHFRLLHKVELSRVSMIEKEPWMTCDICMAKFWTYQGLTRHSVQLHKRELSLQVLPTKTFKCFFCLQTQTNPLNHLSTFHNITLLDMYHSRRCCMCNKRFRSAPSFEEHMVLQHHDIFANKDVLCTVLHALSTALSLKRQETLQHRTPATTSFIKSSPQSSTGFGPGSSEHVRSSNSSAAVSFQKNSPEACVPNKMPAPSKADLPIKAPIASSTGQPEAKKRHRQSNDQSKGNDSDGAVKTPPKKSNDEDVKELNKLYEDYADIGRPILRSMRNRLSRDNLEKATGESPKESMTNPNKHAMGLSKSPDALTEEIQKSVAETNLSDEPLPKRLCKDSCSNDIQDGSSNANQQKQLPQVINGDTTDSAECQKTS